MELTAAIVESVRCARRCHRYRLDGWGVGELWVGDGAVLAHELTAAAAGETETSSPLGGADAPADTIADARSREGDDFVPNLLQRIHAHLRGRPTDYDDVPLDLSWCTPFQAELAHALRAVPWGEVVTYGELAASPAARARRGRPGRSAPQNRFWLLVPCHRVVGADGIGGYGAAGRRAQAAAARARECRSLRTSAAELAAIAPRRRCDRLAELSALFHTAGSIHLLGRGRVALHLDLGSPAVARRGFALLRELGIHSEIRTYPQHAFDAPTRYQLHVDGERARSRCSPRPGSSTARHRPLERPAAPCGRDARAVAAPTCAARSSAAGRSPGRARRTSSCARRRATARGSFRRSRRATGIHLGVRIRGRATPPPTPRAGRRSSAVLAAAGAADAVLALEERAVVAAATRAGEPARERRPRQPRAHQPRRAGAARRGPAPPRGGQARQAAAPAPRGGGAAAPPPDAPAGRAGPSSRAGRHEGGHAAAAGSRRRARR